MPESRCHAKAAPLTGNLRVATGRADMGARLVAARSAALRVQVVQPRPGTWPCRDVFIGHPLRTGTVVTAEMLSCAHRQGR